MVHAHLQIPTIAVIEVLDLLGSQVDIHTTHQIDNRGEALKVHFHTAVNRHAEVCHQRLAQHGEAAAGIGCVHFVGLIAGNVNIHIPHKRGQGNGLILGVDRYHDHGIRTLPAFTGAAILTYQQEIDQILMLDDHRRFVIFRLGHDGRLHRRAGVIRRHRLRQIRFNGLNGIGRQGCIIGDIVKLA